MAKKLAENTNTFERDYNKCWDPHLMKYIKCPEASPSTSVGKQKVACCFPAACEETCDLLPRLRSELITILTGADIPVSSTTQLTLFDILNFLINNGVNFSFSGTMVGAFLEDIQRSRTTNFQATLLTGDGRPTVDGETFAQCINLEDIGGLCPDIGICFTATYNDPLIVHIDSAKVCLCAEFIESVNAYNICNTCTGVNIPTCTPCDNLPTSTMTIYTSNLPNHILPGVNIIRGDGIITPDPCCANPVFTFTQIDGIEITLLGHSSDYSELTIFVNGNPAGGIYPGNVNIDFGTCGFLNIPYQLEVTTPCTGTILPNPDGLDFSMIAGLPFGTPISTDRGTSPPIRIINPAYFLTDPCCEPVQFDIEAPDDSWVTLNAFSNIVNDNALFTFGNTPPAPIGGTIGTFNIIFSTIGCGTINIPYTYEIVCDASFTTNPAAGGSFNTLFGLSDPFTFSPTSIYNLNAAMVLAITPEVCCLENSTLYVLPPEVDWLSIVSFDPVAGTLTLETNNLVPSPPYSGTVTLSLVSSCGVVNYDLDYVISCGGSIAPNPAATCMEEVLGLPCGSPFTFGPGLGSFNPGPRIFVPPYLYSDPCCDPASVEVLGPESAWLSIQGVYLPGIPYPIGSFQYTLTGPLPPPSTTGTVTLRFTSATCDGTVDLDLDYIIG